MINDPTVMIMTVRMIKNNDNNCADENEKRTRKSWQYTIIVSPRWTSGVCDWSVLSTSRPRGKVLLTLFKECAFIMVRYLSSVNVIAAEIVISAVFLTWGWHHDVEEVFSCPTIHYGIQKALQGHSDGLYGFRNKSMLTTIKDKSLCTHQCHAQAPIYHIQGITLCGWSAAPCLASYPGSN